MQPPNFTAKDHSWEALPMRPLRPHPTPKVAFIVVPRSSRSHLSSFVQIDAALPRLDAWRARRRANTLEQKARECAGHAYEGDRGSLIKLDVRREVDLGRAIFIGRLSAQAVELEQRVPGPVLRAVRWSTPRRRWQR
jgi:hypothetical protein